MSKQESSESPGKKVMRIPGRAFRWVSDMRVISDAKVRNWLRRLRRASVDYVLMPIGGPLPERQVSPGGFLQRRLPIWPKPPLSLEYLNGRLQLIGDADNVKGVLLIFRGFTTSLATIQNLRHSLLRLRETGKEVVVYTPYLDLLHYYAASAADRVYAPPGATFDTLGLRTEVVFLKDALQQIGVEVDVVQISPYKTAFDNLQHAGMTPEYREQMDWLLDDLFDTITADMAQGRGMDQEAFVALVDGAPHFAQDALALGLIDGLAYEDELADLLAAERESAADKNERETGPKEDGREADQKERPPVKIMEWPQAYRLLMEKPRRSGSRFVGVISMEGMMTMGPSRRPPIELPIPFLGGATAGEQTMVDLLRRAERLQDMAALVLHVDSGGGSALAADFIGREIERIGRKIPVLAYMGGVAASGGYYVSAPARHIMCQTGTTTGSIGVITLRPSTRDLFQKLMINRTTLQRGAHADLYSDNAPMNEEERRIFSEGVLNSYDQFKRVVAGGRDLPLESLDPICEGRVWTGRQALEHKLVDSHGDFVDALRTAAELGGLIVDDAHTIPVANLTSKRDGYLLPRPIKEIEEAARLLSRVRLREMSGRPLWVLPFELRVE